MNPYQGLSLPELMELLHGISMPPSVSMFPQTVGWVILLFWVFVLALLAGWHYYGKYKSNAYRREAHRRLKQITNASYDDSSNGLDKGYAIAVLLKQTALAAYPRYQVASLYGARWADFLRYSSNNDPQVCAVADRLSIAAYRKETITVDGLGKNRSGHSDIDHDLVGAAAQWIKVHQSNDTKVLNLD